MDEVQIGAWPYDSAALSVVSIAPRYATKISPRCQIGGMKVVEEVRRERLLMLKAQYGSFASINKLIDRQVTDSTLSQIANQSTGSKTDKPKMMGSPQARFLEEKLNIERGWMDTDPALVAKHSAWPLTGITEAQFDQVPEPFRLAAAALMLAAIAAGEITEPAQRETSRAA